MFSASDPHTSLPSNTKIQDLIALKSAIRMLEMGHWHAAITLINAALSASYHPTFLAQAQKIVTNFNDEKNSLPASCSHNKDENQFSKAFTIFSKSINFLKKLIHSCIAFCYLILNKIASSLQLNKATSLSTQTVTFTPTKKINHYKKPQSTKMIVIALKQLIEPQNIIEEELTLNLSLNQKKPNPNQIKMTGIKQPNFEPAVRPKLGGIPF